MKVRAGTDSLMRQADDCMQECAVPKSRVRKKPVYTPRRRSRQAKGQPAVASATMVACFVVGLVWIALYYVTQADMPGLRTLGAFNLVAASP